MEPNSLVARVARPSGLLLTALPPLILLISPNVCAETLVYRCFTPEGEVEFRQSPCSDDTEEQEIRIEDRKTGWEPSHTKVERRSKGSTKSSSRKRKTDKDSRAAQAKREEKCWKKHQLLDKVNWKLRRGYKPATGVKLRRQRQEYEAYIRQFCE